ncbi:MULTISPECIES: aminoacyl-tRNA deacylase [Halomonas]|uniref:Aminoacyl-tRNA deacylase n=2 Tax=Halomonadaceae TaxID=28256 RepID=A0ABQ0U1J5_9GAMM|nr:MULTISPECIES: YbaK/EbsC family protein [Halomonas]MDR5889397.1 YbaK/EbsC family protein [Halomonas salina]RAH36968.1 deacylase [Halomonas sp. SL1]WJY06083.1 YbaK/EbsC family protein [Halomonas halophila]GEK72414.1 aminoacyl-tRNA deacylase [Halomonas halophila]
MAMPMTIREYLRACDIDYEEVTHPHAVSTSRIAEMSHVGGHQMAKAVMLHGDQGYRVAVVPSTRDADLQKLSQLFHEHFELASEEEVQREFDDCDPGATIAVGQAYGLKVYLDDQLRHQPDIYFDAGDHETLVHMSGNEFERLMTGSRHGAFSRPH